MDGTILIAAQFHWLSSRYTDVVLNFFLPFLICRTIVVSG